MATQLALGITRLVGAAGVSAGAAGAAGVTAGVFAAGAWVAAGASEPPQTARDSTQARARIIAMIFFIFGFRLQLFLSTKSPIFR